jgi:three-Cys-motif partner protein
LRAKLGEVPVRNETLFGEQDGLEMNEEGVGSWTAEKYRQFQLYAHQFTQGMKGKWKSLMYLDLYAGSGQRRIPETNEIFLGSPLIALSLDVQFDQYVFCEKDKAKLAALRERVSRKTYSEFPKRHELRILPEAQRIMQVKKYSAPPTVDIPLAALSV